MKRNHHYHCALTLVLFGAALRAQTLDALREGVVYATPRPGVSTGLSLAQPSSVSPPSTCAGRQVKLTPPPGTLFPEHDPGLRVLFSPCGVPGVIVKWTREAILVKVPLEAEDGPVWLASDVGSQADAELRRGAACLRSIADHSVEPERPQIVCDPKVGDRFDPQLATKLRGTPVSDALIKSPAPPLFRAEERPQDAPPACRVVEPERRAPLSFATGSKQVQITNGAPTHSQCFDTCQQVRVANNFLKVQHAPRVERFLPAVSEMRAPRLHRVERGNNRVEWRVVSDAGEAAMVLSRDDSPGAPVALAGSTDVDVRGVTRLTLSGSNACGVTDLTIALEPATTLRIAPERLDLDTGVSAELRVSINEPLDGPIDVALDNSSAGMVRITPAVVTIPAGSVETRVQVQLVGTPAARGVQVGQITARAAGATVATALIDSPNPSRLYGRSVMAISAPGPTQVLLRGRLRYRECLGERVDPLALAPSGRPYTIDGERCLMDGTEPVFKPIRRARVEIWDQAPIVHELRAVVETDDTGLFEALAPSSGAYDVTVVASSFAGQVNLENDAITWFWRPLRMRQTGAGGATLTYNFDFGRADARHFNALDAITRGLEYALQRTGVAEADADPTFRKTVVIPGSSSAGTTLRVGHATHIWVGAWNQIFIDDVMLHEYGHHMQHANGTYQAWGTFHNGCYATVVAGPACQDRMRPPGETDAAPDAGCWVNSPQLAWFEGFPTYFGNMVLDFDSNRALTRTTYHAFRHAPVTGATCPLLSSPHLNHLNEPITGAAVEDHVQGALMSVRLRGDVVSGGTPLTPTAIEDEVFRIFFNRLRDRAPTVFDFQDQWDLRFPMNFAWRDIMSVFQMTRGR